MVRWQRGIGSRPWFNWTDQGEIGCGVEEAMEM